MLITPYLEEKKNNNNGLLKMIVDPESIVP